MRQKEKLLDHYIGKLKNFWVAYTVIFVVMALIVFFPFYHNGKTLIWGADGWTQHFKAMVYYGRWLRHIVNELIENHTLDIPFYSFSLGYGGDVLTTLHYYAIGDPLVILAAFVPTRYMHHLYDSLIILRFYLAGVSFILFCLYKGKKKDMALLSGSFVYVFCAFALTGMRHPYFLNPMIYFPWLLLGIERIIKEKKKGVFIGAVFISAVSNFYFFYMLVLLTVLYVSLRLLFVYRNHREEGKKRIKFVLQHLFSIGMSALTGVMLSAFIFLPVVAAFLNSPRIGVKHTVRLFSTPFFLERFPSAFLAYADPGDWSCMGFSGISLLAVLLLYIRKKHLDLKITFAMLTIFVLFPVFGHIFNGFSYVTNRWIWAYSMLVAYIVVTVWHDLLAVSVEEGRRLLLLAGIYFFICMSLHQSVTKNMGFSVALAFAGLCTVILFRGDENEKHISAYILCGILLISMAGNAWFGYSVSEGNYVAEFVDDDEIYQKLTDTEGIAVMNADADEEDTFYRYTGSGDINTTLINGLSNTRYYWSLSNKELFEFMKKMAVLENTTFIYGSLDNRTVLNALTGIKYFVADKDDIQNRYKLPYAFVEKDLSDDRYSVYRNDLTMPLGYTYSSFITSERFDELSPLERQEAMLQEIWLEEKPEIIKETSGVLTVSELDFTVECDSNEISWQGNDFVVTQEDACITLAFQGMENAETYVYVEGMEYKGTERADLYKDDPAVDPYGLYTQEDWYSLSKYDRNLIKYNERYRIEPSRVVLKIRGENVDGGKVSKPITYIAENDLWPTGRHDFLANLGYDKLAKQTVTIGFSDVGTYHFDKIQVLCLPMDHYIEQISALRKDVLQDIDMHYHPEIGEVSATDLITGTITVDTPKILCLTIPYSTGWRAYVDGERRPLLRGNIMFSALELEPGFHDIRLEYCTPGLKTGMMISVAGMVLLLAEYLRGRYFRKKQR